MSSLDFSSHLLNLMTLLSSMVFFLLFIWASKKILMMLEVSNLFFALEEKRENYKREERMNRNKITNGFLKTSVSKVEKNRRRELYKLKKSRLNRDINNQHYFKNAKGQFISKSGEVLTPGEYYRYRRSLNKKRYVSKGGYKLRTKTGRVITSKPKKVYSDKDFMSKKYRDAVKSGKFNKKRTQRDLKPIKNKYDSRLKDKEYISDVVKNKPKYGMFDSKEDRAAYANSIMAQYDKR